MYCIIFTTRGQCCPAILHVELLMALNHVEYVYLFNLYSSVESHVWKRHEKKIWQNIRNVNLPSNKTSFYCLLTFSDGNTHWFNFQIPLCTKVNCVIWEFLKKMQMWGFSFIACRFSQCVFPVSSCHGVKMPEKPSRDKWCEPKRRKWL